MSRRSLLAVVCVAVLVTGCNRPPAPTPAPMQKAAVSTGTIGVSLLTLENPFFKVIGDNITEEGKKHGYDAIVGPGCRSSRVPR